MDPTTNREPNKILAPYDFQTLQSPAIKFAFRPGWLLVGALALLSSASLPLMAQSTGGAFAIIKTTIDNGGGRSTGGQFIVTGSIAQPDASLQSASGGAFLLTGGFWANGVIVAAGENLFSDGFEGF